MKASVTWQQDLCFEAKTDSGKSIVMDGNSEGSALSPMESILLAVGACSSIDVVDILKKSRQDISDCHCELEAERAEAAPRVFTAIHAHYQVSGANVSEKHLARAVQLSAEKYCSVMLMLQSKVKITTSYALM
ncbi:MAG: putative redox protein [Paraglaciecola sp.]|jgi:putative redox protein